LSESKKYEKTIVFILFCVQFTHLIDFVIMMPLGPKLMRAFDIGPQQFSMLVSAYAFSSAICGLFSSFYMDQYDRKKALLFLYAGFTLGTLACGLAPNFWALLLARVVAGGFGGVMGGLIFSIIADAIPEMRRGTATGTVLSAFGVSSVIGIPTGLFLAEKFNWHAPFIFLSVLSLLVLLLASKVIRPMTNHRDPSGNQVAPWPKFIELLTTPNHVKAFLLTTFMMLSGFSIIPFVSAYMVRNVGLLESQLPYIYFFGGLFTLVTSRVIGKLADRFGRHRVYYVLAIISLFPIMIVTHLPPLPLPLILAASTFFFIFVSGRYVPAMTIITSAVMPRSRGSFMSLHAAIQSISMGFASTIAGLIITTEPNTGQLQHYGIMGVVSCLITVICIFLASRVRSV
jgi:predicted MFS family arabinose efflux permease